MNNITCVVNDIAGEGSDFRSEHGLSLWIDTPDGSLLYDTGQSADVLTHNLRLLGLDKDFLSALAFSHAHYDHTGGLEALAPFPEGLEIYALPDLFRQRYSKRKGKYEQVGLQDAQTNLLSQVDLHAMEEPQPIFPHLWTTGVIKDRSEPEGRSSHHFIKAEDGWQPDRYLDDMSLVLQTQKGLILICGCCHAGLLNTLAHVRDHFPQPIIAIVGGTHLLSAEGPLLDHVVDVLQTQYAPLDLYLNHCTGEHAIQVLKEAFPNHVQDFWAGSSIQFS